MADEKSIKITEVSPNGKSSEELVNLIAEQLMAWFTDGMEGPLPKHDAKIIAESIIEKVFSESVD